MANPHRGEVEIEIGGQKRRLRYSLGALAELQEDLGLRDINELLKVTLTVRTLISFLWAGLKHAEPDLTKETIDGWVVPISPTIEAVDRAMALAVFGQTEAPKLNPPPPKASDADSTGKKSGAKPSAKSASRRGSSGT